MSILTRCGLLLLLLTGCNSISNGKPHVNTIERDLYDQLPMVIGLSSDVLYDTKWKLEYVWIAGVQEPSIIDGQWVAFTKDHLLSAYDGCNNLSGAYKAMKDGRWYHEYWSTYVGCTRKNPQGTALPVQPDQVFIQLLEKSDRYRLDDSYLWLYSAQQNDSALVFLQPGFNSEVQQKDQKISLKVT